MQKKITYKYMKTQIVKSKLPKITEGILMKEDNINNTSHIHTKDSKLEH